jgi:hypothetical protein
MKNLEQARRNDFRTGGLNTVWVRTNWDEIFIGNDSNDSHSILREEIEKIYPKKAIVDAGYAYITGGQLNVYEGSECLEIPEDNLFRPSSFDRWRDFAEKNRLNLQK